VAGAGEDNMGGAAALIPGIVGIAGGEYAGYKKRQQEAVDKADMGQFAKSLLESQQGPDPRLGGDVPNPMMSANQLRARAAQRFPSYGEAIIKQDFEMRGKPTKYVIYYDQAKGTRRPVPEGTPPNPNEIPIGESDALPKTEKPLGREDSLWTQSMALAKGNPAEANQIYTGMTRTPKETASRMTEAQIKEWGFKPGTIAVIENGVPKVVNKATTADMFDDVPDGLPQEQYLDWIEVNHPELKQMVPVARKVMSGDMKMPTAGRPGSTGEIVQALVSRAAQGVDIGQRFKTAENYAPSGRIGQNLTSVVTTMNHLNELMAAHADLKNNDYPAANYIANQVKTNFGDPALTRFNNAKVAVASEGRKIFAGASGGGITELEHWLDGLSSSASTQQMEAAKNTLYGLISGRTVPLLNEYNDIMGKNLTMDEFISKYDKNLANTEGNKKWIPGVGVKQNGK